MAQHDYNIANQSGADFRSDLNDALSAIASTNSGDTSPATTFANQLWIDTANNLLKIRNEANSAWITTGIDITADNSVDINAGTIDGITTLSFSTGTSVTSILDEDNLSSDSATALATQQSIKAYVDSQVGSVDTLAEILANGNATGGNDIVVQANDDITLSSTSKVSFNAESLTIQHNNIRGLIDNYAGELRIINNATSEDISFYGDDGAGDVEVYFRLDTSIGDVKFQKDAKFIDGKKVILGTNEDLEIYHDGSDSYIDDNGSGDLYIKAATNLYLQANGTNDTYLKATSDNAVELYYDNAKKLETTTNGVDVSGTLEADAIDINNLKIQSELDTTPTNDLDSYIFRAAGTHPDFGGGDLVIMPRTSASRDIFFLTGSTTPLKRLEINGIGDIRFYDVTGATHNITYDISAASLAFADDVKATFGDDEDLQIYHDGTQNYIEDAGTGNLNFKSNGNNFNFFDGSDNLVLQIDLNSATKLYHNTSEKLATTSTGIDVTGNATISGDSIIIETSKTPSSASDTGTKGQIAYDDNYIYVCTATNTWKRVAISTW
jgi:hypothetical protein